MSRNNFSNSNSNSKNRRGRFKKSVVFKDDNYIIFEDAEVIETLPSTTFKAKVDRDNKDINKKTPPIHIVCNLKTNLIKRKVMIVKGDKVKIAVNLNDMYFDEKTNVLKGLIYERK